MLLWDATTGAALLSLEVADYVSAVAFAPDARRLAVSSRDDGVRVWALEHGRGIETLRGLTGPVIRPCFARDGRQLAALAHNWQVAIWDRPDSRLRHVLDAPLGFTADNAALAFAPDGRRLAFSTGRTALLWDVATGTPRVTWPLPPGLVDTLAFPAADRLLLFRMETEDGTVPPDSNHRAPQFPRVGRLRNLLSAEPLKEIGRTDCNGGIHMAAAPADGRYFAVEGVQHATAGPQQSIQLLDSVTGKLRWQRPMPQVTQGCYIFVDSEGAFLVRPSQVPNETLLVRLVTNEAVASLPGSVIGVGPGVRHIIRSGPEREAGHHPGFTLYERDAVAPLIVLGIDSATISLPVFSADGALLAWGNSDGTVTVAHLESIRRRLAQVGLGW